MDRVLGSSEIEVSEENHEVIPDTPSYWTTGYKMKSFYFVNHQECHISVNGSDSILIKEGQGFYSNIKEGHPKVSSFIIIDEGIEFTWMGVA